MTTMVVDPAVDLSNAIGRVEVYNPARTDERVGSYPLLRAEHVDRVVAWARRAFPGWSGLEPIERLAQVREAGAAIGPADALAPLLVREQGRRG